MPTPVSAAAAASLAPRPAPRRPTLVAALTAAAMLGAVAGCSHAPGLPAGPDATSTACTQLLRSLPATVLDRTRNDTASPGSAGWGSPPVVLACGQPAIGPTNDACLSVDDVDWVVGDPDADPIRFTTYGRTPTVVVLVPASYGRDRASAALVDLGAAVGSLPRHGAGCS